MFFSFFTCSIGGDNPLTSRAPDTLLENSCQITREEIRKLLTHDCTFPLKQEAISWRTLCIGWMPTPSSLCGPSKYLSPSSYLLDLRSLRPIGWKRSKIKKACAVGPAVTQRSGQFFLFLKWQIKKLMKLSKFGLGLWNLGSSNNLEVSQEK